MPKPPLIHIGMPKCASTWLQRHFFNRDHGYRRCLGPLQMQLAFIDPAPGEWQRPRHLGLKVDDGLVPTFTSENLVGNPLTSGADAERNLERLRRAMPQARILLIIREQRDMLRSIYQLLVNWGYPYSMDELLAGTPTDATPRFSPAYLRFDRIISAYQASFGPDRVLVLPLEQLRCQPEQFLRTINDFAGVDSCAFPLRADPARRENPGRSLASLACKRLYNRFIARTTFAPHGLVAPAQIQGAANLSLRLPASLDRWQEQRFRRHVEQHLGDYYARSNARSAALSGLALAPLGYVLP